MVLSSPSTSPKAPSTRAGSASAPTTPSRTNVASSRSSSVVPGRSSVAAPSTTRSKSTSSTASPESEADRSRSSGGNDSVVFSSGGSVVYRPRKSDSSTVSELEVLGVTESIAALKVHPSAPSSSSPDQVKVDPRASVNPPPASEAQTSPAARAHHRSVETTSSRTRTTSGPLNPTAAAFDAQDRSVGNVPSSLDLVFASILRSGKNVNGDLTLDAKGSMAAYGLRPIPSLHGTSLLPYSRNPSGSDAFRFTVEDDEHGFEPIPDDEIAFHASQRNVPLPLPGNARYTPAGRQLLAQQRRIASAPLASASITSSSSRMPDGSTRRVATAPELSSSTSEASVPSIGPSSASRVAHALATEQQQYQHSIAEQLQQAQARDETIARQAHLAQQLQQLQLAQSYGHAGAFLPPHLAPYGSMQPSSLGAPDPAVPPFQPVAPPLAYPISGLAPSSSSATPYGPLQSQRRSSIVISPEGQIAFVDSATLLQLAGQQVVDAHGPLGRGARATGSFPSSRTTSYGAVFEMDSGEEQGLSEEGPDPHLAAFAASTSSSRRRPSRAEQLDRRRRKHRPTLSDATVTAQTYVEQGRRKSAMASFPPPGGWRRPSVASSLAPEPRHASGSAAGTRSASISGGHAASRTSLKPGDSPSTSGSSGPYRPPMVRRRSSSPSGSEHDYSATTAPLQGPSRVLSSIGNVSSAPSTKAGSHGELHATFQLPPSAPIVQVEPPTPKPVRTKARSVSAYLPQAAARSSDVTVSSGVPTCGAPSINSGSSDGTVTPGGDDKAAFVGVSSKGKGYHGRGKRREARKSDPVAPSSPHVSRRS
ncbi:hypothetical protein JCM9279_006318 [Rhodotorula babjevae]